MYFNENWEETKERFKAWWDGEVIDRPIIQVVAPKNGYRGPLGTFAPDIAWRLSFHPEKRIETLREFEKRCVGTYFGGESYPHMGVYSGGAGEMPALLGGIAKYAPEVGTTWDHANIDPSLAMNWRELLEISVDHDEWKKLREVTKFLLEHGEGKIRVWNPVVGWAIDTLAALRSPGNLVMDMFKRPNDVKAFCKRFFEEWSYCFDEIHRMAQEKQRGSDCQCMALWHSGKTMQTQCDFAALLSPSCIGNLSSQLLGNSASMWMVLCTI